MKIIVFLQGTSIMHKSGLGKTPHERINQVKGKEPSVHQYETYIPVGNANEKLRHWVERGAEIIYLSSHHDEEDVKKDIQVLESYNFPNGSVLYRRGKETYAQLAERVMPDVLIEDDCESIGGEVEMTYPHIDSNKRKQIKSIVVDEFTGIDKLPDNPKDLLIWKN